MCITKKRKNIMNNTQPLLSICIPTYNRAKILDQSLENIERELRTIDTNDIEFIKTFMKGGFKRE